MADSILETEDLVKRFGGLVATDGINLHVNQGEILSIIGPNGAGKSTLLNQITGMLEPTEGAIRFRGESIVGLPPHQIVQQGIAMSFQTASIFPQMTVSQNAQIAGLGAEHGSFSYNFLRTLGNYPEVDAVADRVLEAVELSEKSELQAENLPYGDKRRLEIAIALASDPDLLLMDEPTAGMSPHETNATVELIERIKEELDLTLIFVEHDMEIVFSISDRIVVLDRGSIIADGPPDEVRGDVDVQEAYLGGAEV